jgi:predicted Rossmann fold nucleotide-binding protein DprA/Smf involved in DNA uptake
MWREDLSDPPKTAAVARARRKRRRIIWSIAIGLAAALGSGAVATAAYYAEPGNPLFAVTERIFTQQASAANAQAAKERIADARTAVGQQHLPEAQHLLEEAEKLIASVTSLVDKQVLTDELRRVRALLDAALTGTPVPTPAPTAVPSPTPTTTPTTTPVPTRSGGLPPLPLPTISVPPLLPSLPLG